LGIVDGLDTVCVVVGKFGIEDHLGVNVNASVDEADGIKVDGNDGGVVENACDNLVVLLLEVVGCVSGPVTAVGLAPDADTVVKRLVFGESVQISCGFNM
jgi:hypothetical protein